MDARFCIAGGGPAGIMLGYLLARAGHSVIVLEKHADFFRDFRGDTIHPSTLDVLAELGVLDAFLALPHQEVRELGGQVGETTVRIADFRRLPTRCRFLAFIPQWDFLNFLTDEARRFPGFRLMLESSVVDLVTEGERVVGVVAQTPQGRVTLRAGLVVGADGRHSDVRRLSGLRVRDVGAPIDVLWMRLPRGAGDPGQAFGRITRGAFFILIDRGDYYQAGYVIRKGGFEAMKAAGIAAFQERLRTVAPFLGDRVTAIDDWDKVSLLTVTVDRLERWYREGLLCIGDAAHAMSPVGGVGINLAIQDAVATANILCRPPVETYVPSARLAAVQRRRGLPTRLTQTLQVAIQNAIVVPTLSDRTSEPLQPPFPLRLVDRIEPLRAIPAYVIGVGFRPEHAKTFN